MAYNNHIIENNLTQSKDSKSFEGEVGSIMELHINVKEIITNHDAGIQVIVQESDDNDLFSDFAMTRMYDSSDFHDVFVFKKQKPYHRFHFTVLGTNPSIDIELTQEQIH
ncbi:hypothetical protein [Metabacillus fastidiosus]|uniref:hypothetical protein n=1 Tax=Metabacillus fastidiosus TaxID=1458 RepID=UPI002E1D9229|nr:hypothetical protein [Metabacillus fastidiosus]